jgi:uncharacterized membrane-anchored protein YhcB (DUF1043 family)
MQAEISDPIIIKTLSYIISGLVAIICVMLKIIFSKVSDWIKQQKETNIQLALINQALGYQKEKIARHDFQIITLGDRLNAAINRLTMVMAKKEETHARQP